MADDWKPIDDWKPLAADEGWVPIEEKKAKTTIPENLKLGAATVANNIVGAVEGVKNHFEKDPQARLSTRWKADDLRAKIKEKLGVSDEKIGNKEQGISGKLVSGAVPLATALVGGIPWLAAQAMGSGVNTADELKNELPPEQHDVANKVGLLEAGSQAIGMAIPGFGAAGTGVKELAKVGLKAGLANTAQGFGTNWLQQRVLEGAGHKDLADRYDPKNAENRIVDFVMGAAPTVAVGAGKGIYEKHANKAAQTKLDALKTNLDAAKAAKEIEQASIRKQASEGTLPDPTGIDQQTPMAPQYGGKMPGGNDQESFNSPQRAEHQQPYMMNRYGGEDLPPGVVNPKALEAVNRLYGDNVNQPEMTVDQYGRYGTDLEKPGVVNPKALDRVVNGPALVLFAEDGPTAAERILAKTVGAQNEKLDKMRTGPFKIQTEVPPEKTAAEIKQGIAAREIVADDSLFPMYTAPKTMDDVIELSKTAKDMPSYTDDNRNKLAKSASYVDQKGTAVRTESAIHNNPVLKYVNKIVTDATLKAQDFVRKNVEPFAKTWTEMNLREQTEARTVAQYADQNKLVLTPEQLRAAGYEERVVQFLGQYREAFDNFHGVWNQSKEENGLDPVKYREGYSPASFKGEYTSVVTSKDGQLLAVLKTGSMGELKLAQRKAKEMFPDAYVSDWNRRSMNTTGQGEFVQALADIQKLLGNDPRLAQITDAMKQRGLVEGTQAFGFDVHELNKQGILGNEGNKFWKSPTENNTDFFKAAINYFEEGSMNQNMVKPMSEMKSMLADPTLVKNQRNTLEYLQGYMDYLNGKPNDVGKFMNSGLDILADATGHGFGAVRNINSKLMNAAQHLWMGGLNVRAFIAQMTQPLQTGLPMMMFAAKELGSKMSPVEAAQSLTKGSSLYALAWMEAKSGRQWDGLPPEYRAAYQYAESHGLTIWSEYEHVKAYGENRATRGVSKASGALLSLAEGMTRPTVFFGLVDQLLSRDVPAERAFDLAYNMTQDAMVDYNHHQKPQFYGNLGEMGRQMGQLKTYSHANINQMRLLAKYDKTALTAMLSVQLALAGVKGIVGYGVAASAYEWMTGDNLTEDIKKKMAQWAGIKAESDASDRIMYGMLSADSGFWLHSSLSAGNMLPANSRDLFSTLMPSGIGLAGKVIGDAVDMYKDPGIQPLKNMVKEVTPTSLKGAWDVNTNLTRNRLLNKKGEPTEPELTAQELWLHENGLGLDRFSFGKKREVRYEKLTAEQKRSERAKNLAIDLKSDLVNKEFTKDMLIHKLTEYSKLNDDPQAVMKLLQSLPKERLKKYLSVEELKLLSPTVKNMKSYERMRVPAND